MLCLYIFLPAFAYALARVCVCSCSRLRMLSPEFLSVLACVLRMLSPEFLSVRACVFPRIPVCNRTNRRQKYCFFQEHARVCRIFPAFLPLPRHLPCLMPTSAWPLPAFNLASPTCNHTAANPQSCPCRQSTSPPPHPLRTPYTIATLHPHSLRTSLVFPPILHPHCLTLPPHGNCLPPRIASVFRPLQQTRR